MIQINTKKNIRIPHHYTLYMSETQKVSKGSLHISLMADVLLICKQTNPSKVFSF